MATDTFQQQNNENESSYHLALLGSINRLSRLLARLNINLSVSLCTACCNNQVNYYTEIIL